MRRLAIVAFAIVASVLVATAPAEAASSVRTISINNTDADFENAQTFEGVAVSGTGTSAFVELSGGEPIVDHRWRLNETSGSTAIDDVGEADAEHNGDPTLGVAGIEDTAYSLDSDDWLKSSRVDVLNEDTTTIVGWIKPSSLTDSNNNNYLVTLNDNGASSSRVGIYQPKDSSNINIFIHDASFEQSSSSISTALSTNDWNLVVLRVTGNEVKLSTNATGRDTLVHTADPSTFGNLNWTINDFDGSQAGFSADYDDWQVYDRNITESEEEDLYNNPGTVLAQDTGRYRGQAHTGENVEDAFVDVEISGDAWANVTVKDGGGTVINTGNFSSTGNHTIDISSSTGTSHDIEVFFDESAGGDVKLFDEGITATVHDPTFDNSTGSPDGSIINQETISLQIDANDTDFSTAQGDELTVEFSSNRSGVLGTDTLTANGTASIDWSPTIGGNHTWSATVTDDYGLTDSSADFSIRVPSSLAIREETPPHDYIKSANITVRFFEETETNPTIVERSTSTGNVSLGGLATGSEFVVTANGPGVSNRTVIIEGIFDQDTIYLLNQSKVDTIGATISIQDRTGLYQVGDAELIIEHAINDSGSFEWKRVYAEKLSGAGLSVQFKENERYRFTVENQAGDSTDLGHINADPSFDGDLITLPITSVDPDLDDEGQFGWNATYQTISDGSDRVRFVLEVNDAGVEAESLRLIVHEFNNASNEIRNSTHGDVSSLTVYTDVPTDGSTWVVEIRATIGGESIEATQVVGNERYLSSFPLATLWQERGIILVMLIVGGAFSAFNAGVGAVILSFTGALGWYAGLLPSTVGAGVILLGATVGILWIAKGGSL